MKLVKVEEIHSETGVQVEVLYSNAQWRCHGGLCGAPGDWVVLRGTGRCPGNWECLMRSNSRTIF